MEKVKKLRVGDRVRISGTIYTARDASHKRLIIALRRKSLPIPIKDQILYYTGPTPARPGRVIGSCGPTTSSRMDPYTIPLLKKGLKGMIGKGERSKEIMEAIKRYQAAYFAAPGGCGALLAQYIKKAEVIAYPDLGPEAVYKLEIEDFPVIVAIDSKGRNLFERSNQLTVKSRKVGK
jgi:fumarate hydratase subunit beta